MPSHTREEADEFDAVLTHMVELLDRSRGDVAAWLDARPVFLQLQARLDDLARKAFPPP